MDVSASKDKGRLDSVAGGNRLPKLLFLAGLLLIVLWLGIKGWRIADAGRSLLARQDEAEALAAEGLVNADPEAAEALVMGLRQDVVVLERETAIFLPLAPAFGWLPKVGPLLAAAPQLVEMADAGTEAAVYGVGGMKPALALLQGEGGGEALIPELLAIVDEARPELARAAVAMERVRTARAEIENVEGLPWRVRTLLQQMDEKLYLADFLSFVQVAPEMMGHDGKRNYLLVAQNEDEIRPTGGFFSGVGLLALEEGRIVSLQFEDANRVDAWAERWSLSKPYGFPPQPLYQLMGIGLFLFRDANFWPDWPVAAEQAMALYRYGQEDAPPLDGVIAIDQRFLEMLLQVTGPLEIAGMERRVSANNVIENMRDAWSATEEQTQQEWLRTRQDFLGNMAGAMQEKLLSDFRSLDPLYLAETLHGALSQKHVQIYVRDATVAAMLDRLNWDGRLEMPADGDGLMVVDSNTGFNKVGPFIESELTYEVTLNEAGRGVAEATVAYAHTYEGEAVCDQGVSYREKLTYADLMQDCFWNYVRLYAPEGSTLLEGSEHRAPAIAFDFSEGWSGGAAEAEDDLSSFAVFANFLLLAPGDTLDARFRYELPNVTTPVAEGQMYRLKLVRQAGVAPRATTIVVHTPPGAEMVSATPAPVDNDRNSVTFTATPETDLTFTVIYRE